MASTASPDPSPSLFDSAGGKANENEIADYRSVSPMAVFSTVLGALSIVGFLDVTGYLIAILAIATGLLALWKIRKYPDIRTGQAYAQAGMGMAVAFTLASVTYWQVVNFQLRREVGEIAQSFSKALNSNNINTPVLFSLPPSVRKTIDTTSLDKSMDKLVRTVTRLGDIVNAIEAMKKTLKSPNDKFEFVELVSAGYFELTARGNALYKSTADGSLALIWFRTPPEGGDITQWYVETIEYPYSPEAEAKPAAVKLPRSEPDKSEPPQAAVRPH